MKILVLGGGQMGSVVAKDLARHGYKVTVADSRKLKIKGVRTTKADLSTSQGLMKVLSGKHDLVVSALPAKLGFMAIDHAIACGKKYVDLSYCPEDVFWLNGKAKAFDTIVVPDCGIAPGISNLIAGRAIYTGNDFVKVCVGVFAKDKSAPLGYAVSWSTDDLIDEYIRTARIICDGEIKNVDALSGVERIYMPGVGGLDAFCTDGLRTLLRYRSAEVKRRKVTLVEKTMRREGHLDEMVGMLKNGTLKEYVIKNCVGIPDQLAMRFDNGKEVIDMVVDGDQEMSAMARATALSCSAFVQIVAEGKITENGVIPPEVIAEDKDIYISLLDKLESNGIKFRTKYPFLT